MYKLRQYLNFVLGFRENDREHVRGGIVSLHSHFLKWETWTRMPTGRTSYALQNICSSACIGWVFNSGGWRAKGSKCVQKRRLVYLKNQHHEHICEIGRPIREVTNKIRKSWLSGRDNALRTLTEIYKINDSINWVLSQYKQERLWLRH